MNFERKRSQLDPYRRVFVYTQFWAKHLGAVSCAGNTSIFIREGRERILSESVCPGLNITHQIFLFRLLRATFTTTLEQPSSIVIILALFLLLMQLNDSDYFACLRE